MRLDWRLWAGAVLLIVFFISPGAGSQESTPEEPGVRARLTAWVDSQEWSGEVDYSAVFFEEEAFEIIFDRDYLPMLRLGSAWYPVRNLSLGLLVGGIYEVGNAVGSLTGTASGEEETFYVIPVQLRLRYEFCFLPNQLLVPSVYGGGDWWYFQETSDIQDNIDGDKTGYHWGADLAILLDPIDPRAAHIMKKDWGVDNTYLTLGYEWLTVGKDEEGLDFSGELYNVGLRLETGGVDRFE